VVQDSAAEAIQIDPSGKWLLDASLAGTLTAYPIASTGAQDTTRTLQQVSLAGLAVQQMAISQNGALISVALGSTGTQSFPFNASNNSPIGAAYSPTTKPYGLSLIHIFTVDPKRESYDFGKFGWCTDPEGNRVELWQPAAS